LAKFAFWGQDHVPKNYLRRRKSQKDKGGSPAKKEKPEDESFRAFGYPVEKVDRE